MKSDLADLPHPINPPYPAAPAAAWGEESETRDKAGGAKASLNKQSQRVRVGQRRQPKDGPKA